jgi:hypothetical protein
MPTRKAGTLNPHVEVDVVRETYVAAAQWVN